VVEVERQQRELQQFRGGGFRPSGSYQQRPGGQQYPSQGRPAGYTPRPFNTNPPQPKDPNAMDVDQTRARGESYLLQTVARKATSKHNA